MCGFQEEARLTPPGGPVFSLALDAREQDGLPNQVWVGNHAKQVGVWLPPATELDPNVSGWVDGWCRAGQPGLPQQLPRCAQHSGSNLGAAGSIALPLPLRALNPAGAALTESCCRCPL